MAALVAFHHTVEREVHNFLTENDRVIHFKEMVNWKMEGRYQGWYLPAVFTPSPAGGETGKPCRVLGPPSRVASWEGNDRALLLLIKGLFLPSLRLGSPKLHRQSGVLPSRR